MGVIPATPADRITGALPVTRLAPAIPPLPAMETRAAKGRPRVLSRDGPLSAPRQSFRERRESRRQCCPTTAAGTRPPIEVETPPAIAAEIPPATRAETSPAIAEETHPQSRRSKWNTAGNRDRSPSGNRGEYRRQSEESFRQPGWIHRQQSGKHEQPPRSRAHRNSERRRVGELSAERAGSGPSTATECGFSIICAAAAPS